MRRAPDAVARYAIELLVANEHREISLAAARIDALCMQNGLAPEVAFEINLAVDELLTNTIIYCYEDGGEHRIEPMFHFNRAEVRRRSPTTACGLIHGRRSIRTERLRSKAGSMGARCHSRAQRHGLRRAPARGRMQHRDPHEERGVHRLSVTPNVRSPAGVRLGVGIRQSERVRVGDRAAVSVRPEDDRCLAG